MGINNSSEKRMKPTMYMIGNDTDKFKSLLDTVILDGKPTLQNIDLENFQKAKIHYTGSPLGEKDLRPPKYHLIEMVKDQSIIDLRLKNFNKDKSVSKQRPELKFKEAKEFIDNIYNHENLLPKNFFILEGKTFPDLYIETDDLIILAEGKWTEKNTTTKTTYLKNRNQMTRHIQCALEYAKGRKVYAFYIVDEGFLKKNTYIENKKSFKIKALDDQTIKLKNKNKILESYKGYTTWQKIESVFPGFHF